jgi:hypothetical protein
MNRLFVNRLVRRGAVVTALVALALFAHSAGALAAWDDGAASVDPTEAAPGDVVTFTATIAWDGTFADGASASFDSTVPAAFTSVSWVCSGENVTCSAGSGSGNSISVEAPVVDTTQPATATLTITAVVAPDAAPGAVDTSICIGGSITILRSNGARALPNLQDGCATATVTITAEEEPTPTPEPTLAPTETATAEPTPATPVVDPTETPAPPAPTQSTGAPVTQLPGTGSGDSRSGFGALTMNGLTALLALAAFAIAGLRLRNRGRSRR